MIRIEYDIELPKNCFDCPLLDDEFNYCHGHVKENKAWELDDYQYNGKPDWCPLIEVRKSCNECMLGAPFETCWRTQCSNYQIKKEKEEQWKNQVKICLEHMEKKYET